MSRRKARIIAFQALYSWDVSKSSLEDLLTFTWLQKDSALSKENEEEVLSDNEKEERTFASLIIAGTIEHISEVDKLIESHLSDSWSMDRINKVTLAILRTSVYEMKFQADAKPFVVIDEAVNIAKDYGTDDSFKFINAVLDKIGRDESKK